MSDTDSLIGLDAQAVASDMLDEAFDTDIDPGIDPGIDHGAYGDEDRRFNNVPEGGYQLSVPESLMDKIQVDPDDPEAERLFAVAADENWSQETVNAVAAIKYESLAEQAENDALTHASEKTKLLKMFDAGGALGEEAAMHKAQEVGAWAINVLAPAIKHNPGIGEEISFSSTTANGVAMLKAFQDATKVGGAPRTDDVNTGGKPLSADQILYPNQGKT